MDTYEQRVRAYEAQGMTTSDAQGCADADDMKSRRRELTAIESALAADVARLSATCNGQQQIIRDLDSRIAELENAARFHKAADDKGREENALFRRLLLRALNQSARVHPDFEADIRAALAKVREPS